ncbi:MAG: fibronectin type III domain-containing protein [Desulfobacterales bacterium]|jgi:YHS domain-containing protein|nr:fibronectin type III domain-containing protein [Desulfobacterales bacterium]
MFKDLRKFKGTLFFLIFYPLPVWMIISLAGCGGGKNVPPASVLVSGEVTLMWKDVDSSVVYNVYTSKSPGVAVYNSYKISHVRSPFTITRIEPGATYYFMVTAEDASGRIWKSREKSYTAGNAKGTVQFGDIISRSAKNTKGSKPKQKVKAAANDTRDAILSWKNVPNATSYNIYWSDKPGVTKKNGTKISHVKSPYKITGLKKGKTYYFVVTAVNASAESKESKEISYFVGP